MMLLNFNNVKFVCRQIWQQRGLLLQGRRRKGYAFTFVAEGILLVSGLITLKLTAAFFGTEGFAEFSIARRAISLINFTILLGLGISIPRYIALSISDEEAQRKQNGYLIAGLFLAGIMIALFFLLSLVIPDILAGLFFGDPIMVNMINPIAIAVTGLYLHTITYAYFRGHLKMWSANMLQLVNIGFAVPICVILSAGNVASSISLAGYWWIITAGTLLCFVVKQCNLTCIKFFEIKSYVKDFLCYGIPRIPGEFSLFGLFAIPTFIVANRVGVEQAGFFSFSISLLQLISALFSIIGIILLPYISRLRSSNEWITINLSVNIALVVSLILICIFVLIAESTITFIIPWIMGDSFKPSIIQANKLLPGSIPYVFYMVLRNPLDALSIWPYNSINLTITLVVVILLIWFGGDIIMPATAMNISLWLLGLLSYFSWKMSFARSRVLDAVPVSHAQ